MAVATAVQPAMASNNNGVENLAPANMVIDAPSPVRSLDAGALMALGQKFKGLFDRYASERIPAEQGWLRNLRQILGIYDPDIERELQKNRSRAYPRLTRVKCVSLLSRIMNLMFPGDEDNWELTASPSPQMSLQAVQQAVQTAMAAQPPNTPLTQATIDSAVRKLADDQADTLSTLIKDQLQELGGDQSVDVITLNRKIIDSGIKYGIGVLEGPFVRKIEQTGFAMQTDGSFQAVAKTIYKPQFDFMTVWDFYPDMSARTAPGEGYFVRKVLGRAALRKLADRPDFFSDQIKDVIGRYPGGNYRAKSWETELRTMGPSIHSDTTSAQANGREKYEIIIWKGPVSAKMLVECGADVPETMMADDVEAELWMVDNYIIKAEINAWRKLGLVMKQAHIFNFDEDDTSPIGQGLPYVVRDSQLSICAAVRMSLDNASVTCGPNLEVNTALVRRDQELGSVQPYKIWYRDDDGLTAQFPAVRPVAIEGHLAELQSLVKMFMEFAEMETFIGPATGGDFQKMPSEPYRTAAGASMLKGDAALPFKDIVRNLDSFTQSYVLSIVDFNKKFNPDLAPEGDYDVIARGATSLIAKEVRGAQIDQLSQTMTPEDWDHVDRRKFTVAKLSSRDLQGMLVSEDEAKANADNRAQQQQAQQDLQNRMLEAQIKGETAGAFKSVTQGQKNAAGADKTSVEAAMTMIGNNEDDPANSPGSGSGTGGKAA